MAQRFGWRREINIHHAVTVLQEILDDGVFRFPAAAGHQDTFHVTAFPLRMPQRMRAARLARGPSVPMAQLS